MIYVIAFAAFISIWSFSSLILIKITKNKRPIDKLKYFDEHYEFREKYEIKTKSNKSIIKSLSKLVPHVNTNKKKVKTLEALLIKADVPITIEELLVIKILCSAALGFLLYAITKGIIFTTITFITVWNIPRFIIIKKKKDRIKSFDNQLSEGITIISNSLKAGYSFLQAIAVVSEETKDPFSKEFKKLLKELSLGISEEEALKNLLFRLESEDLRLILNAILIQKDIGGNLSEILDNISETIRERQKIKDELKTLTAQGKLSGLIVMLIPIFLGATIYLFNKDYMMLLFTTPIGLGMIVASIISQIFGFLIIRNIISIEM